MTVHGVVSWLLLLCLTADSALLKLPLDCPKGLERRGRTYQPSPSDIDVLRFPIVRQERRFHKRQEPYTTPFAFIDTLPHLELGIGNTVPPQETRVLIDTGSSELWVYSIALRDDGSCKLMEGPPHHRVWMVKLNADLPSICLMLSETDPNR